MMMVAEETSPDEELEDQVNRSEREAERLRALVEKLEAEAAAEERELELLKMSSGEGKSEKELEDSVSYARLELGFEKERVLKVEQQKHKLEMLSIGGNASGLESEVKQLKEQLEEETAREQALLKELEASKEAIYVVQRDIDQQNELLKNAQQLSRGSNRPMEESEDVKHYKRELQKAKTALAEENEKISLLKVGLEAEIRKNRSDVDETEQEYLRQIAKLKATLAQI
jgi:hypothetical protein